MNLSNNPDSHSSPPSFNLIPWPFLIVIYLAITTLYHINMKDSWVGYAFIGLTVTVLALEFFKSGDIRQAVFLTDLVFTIVGIVVATALMTYMWSREDQTYPLTFFHGFGYLVLLADSVLSPYNSFRTAQRNFQVG